MASTEFFRLNTVNKYKQQRTGAGGGTSPDKAASVANATDAFSSEGDSVDGGVLRFDTVLKNIIVIKIIIRL